MDFRNNFLFLADLIWLVVFIPFDPLHPHFNNLFLLELSGNRKSGHSIDIGIELFFLGNMIELIIEDFLDNTLEGLNLGQFTVSDVEGIITDHIYSQLIIMEDNR